MFNSTLGTVSSLDQQYLNFAARTASVFMQYPQIEPLRYFIFKELLIQRQEINRIGHAKHWLRPLFHRGNSRGSLHRADVLIWIESHREVIAGALFPVYGALVSRGIHVRLVSYRGPDYLPASTLNFYPPPRALSPAWAKGAWEALCDEISELRHRPLERSFKYACSNTQAVFDELGKILEAVQPKVVLTASMQLDGGAALVVTARSRGASTLLLQHGILQPFYTPLLADYMLTWGDSSNQTLVGFGAPSQRLIALGSPRHDSMAPSTGGAARATLLKALSLPERPSFVFFSNGNDLIRNGEAPIECAKWLETTASQYANEANFIVRLHPNEDGRLYRDCRHLTISKGVPDLAMTLEGSDCVGSLCSTVLYDALLYNKPVWQFYADGWPELADNWRSGLAVRISSQVELSEMIKRMLCGDADLTIDEGLSKKVFTNHGHATRAVTDFIEQRLVSQVK
jgi:hypothetical protein